MTELKIKFKRDGESLIGTIIPMELDLKTSIESKIETLLLLGNLVVIINVRSDKECEDLRKLVNECEGLDLSEDLNEGEVFISASEGYEIIGTEVN